MHPEFYHHYPWPNFATNLKNLREAIAWDHDCKDLHIFLTLGLRALPGYLPWHKSPAAFLLAQDMADGMTNIYLPNQLRATRPKNQEYSLDWFRIHYYQAVDKEAS
jgi:hypothetical protein